MSRRRLTLLSLACLFLIGVFLCTGLGYHLLTPAKKGGQNQVFFVREGATLREVARELETKEIIRSKNLFLFWGRVMGYGRRLKTGEYNLNPGMPPVKILDVLSRGLIMTHPVTIPEGFTVEQIAQLLEGKGLADPLDFLNLIQSPDVLKEYDISGPSLEGYLYPDTYLFSRGLGARSIIDTMVKRFREVVRPYEGEMARLGMTVREVVTLASIVERETGLAEERPVIASVFLNRLRKGMRLESDPTVIYGMKEFNGNLTRKDLAEPTPYNTYVIRGLPPGPIANPGEQAIKAVLSPAETDYLYFVSKNDGSHHFSSTLAEHNQAVNTYQRKRSSRSGKRN